jgi:hypothetical protein
MEVEYVHHANEALALAAASTDERSRKFWLNIAKAWAGLAVFMRENKHRLFRS